MSSTAQEPASSGVPIDRLGSGSPRSDDGLDRVLTVPNLITALRLVLLPLFVWLVFGAHRPVAAAVLLAGLGATDWVDGFVARRWHQVSTLGKIIDPAADRILIGTAVISILIYHAVPLWFGITTLVREGLVSAAVLILAALGAKRIDVMLIGKAGTFALMCAYPAFLLSDGSTGWQHGVRSAAWTAGVVGLALAWAAALAYLPRGRSALGVGRAERSDRGFVIGPHPEPMRASDRRRLQYWAERPEQAG